MAATSGTNNRWVQALSVSARLVVSGVFLAAGVLQLLLPIDQLALIISWVDGHPEWFTRLIGCVDLMGGVGLLLPWVSKRCGVIGHYVAMGCATKQLSAIVFHLIAGDVRVIPLNLLLLACSLLLIRLWASRKPESRVAV